MKVFRTQRWNVVGPLGGRGGGTMKIAPKVGDWMQIGIYYNRKAGRVKFFASDATLVFKTLNVPPHQVYTAAEVACLLTGKVTTPKVDVRMWGFKANGITTAGGSQGSMNGPWDTLNPRNGVALDWECGDAHEALGTELPGWRGRDARPRHAAG